MPANTTESHCHTIYGLYGMVVANLLRLPPKASDCQHTTAKMNVLMSHRKQVVIFFNMVQITNDVFWQKEMYCAYFGTIIFWNNLSRNVTRTAGVRITLLEFTRLVLKKILLHRSELKNVDWIRHKTMLN